MKLFGKLLLASVIGLGLSSTAAMADVAKGQKLYSKKVKKTCDMNGAKFASSKTQEEWEEAKDEGKLSEAFTEACPAGKALFSSEKFKTKYEEHIYDFCYEYASDSGNVPSC